MPAEAKRNKASLAQRLLPRATAKRKRYYSDMAEVIGTNDNGRVVMASSADEFEASAACLIGKTRPRFFYIVDYAVYRLWKNKLAFIPEDSVFFMDACEKNKSLGTVEKIIAFLIGKNACRNDILVCVGGGTVTDTGGFAASVYMRGIRYVNIPTTLLAQTDASVGGKTGVNFGGYKNMIGTITQPSLVFIVPEFLNTLPPVDYRSGFSELVKTALIQDKDLYDSIVSEVSACGNDIRSVGIGKFVAAAVKIKLSVAGIDPTEKGRRKILNFGHTYGHALEEHILSEGGRIAHGDAVSIGMAAAIRISMESGCMETEDVERVISELSGMGLCTECPVPLASLKHYIAHDKKTHAEGIDFVVLLAPGRAECRRISLEELDDLAARVQSGYGKRHGEPVRSNALAGFVQNDMAGGMDK